MHDSILGDILPTTEQAHDLPQTELALKLDEKIAHNLESEVDSMVETHDKIIATAEQIDSAIEADISDEAMLRVTKALSIGLGVTIEADKEGAMKTSEKIKAAVKAFITKFIQVVKKLWTKLMASFVATDEKIKGLKEEVGKVTGTTTADKLGMVCALEAIGYSETEVKGVIEASAKTLKELYAFKDVKKAIEVTKAPEQWALTKMVRKMVGKELLSAGSGKLPVSLMVKAPSATLSKAGKYFILPKSATSFTVVAVGEDESKGSFIERENIALKPDAIKDAAKSKTISKSDIISHLDGLTGRKDIKKEVDDYYGFADAILKGIEGSPEAKAEIKTFYSDAVKYSFAVVNAKMAYNRGIAKDAKTFIKEAGSSK